MNASSEQEVDSATLLSQQLSHMLLGIGPLAQAQVRDLHPIAGDASNREYYRVRFSGAHVPVTAILLKYGDSKGPAFPVSALRQEEAISQEEAMVVLARLLSEHSIPVPELYRRDKVARLLLFEDVGNDALAALARGTDRKALDRVHLLLGDDWLMSLFRRAVDLIAQYQGIPLIDNHPVLQRALAFENYRREATEFVEFYGPTRGMRSKDAEVLNTLLDGLCESLMAVPRRAAHFDFHGYNLLVDERGNLRVIDFQDACQVSYARDLVSLINDRDMDAVLGRERHGRLFAYFLEKLHPAPDFLQHYDLTLLHWDLRVAGRFVKLCQLKNTTKYFEWLPGTLRRVGRTLLRCQKVLHKVEDSLEIVTRLSPEAREGTEDPWPHPQWRG